MNKILLVEKNKVLINRIENIISGREEIAIETFGSNLVELVRLEQFMKSASLLLIDSDIFESDLTKLLTRIRTNESVKAIPIIIIASKLDKSNAILFAKLGKIDVLMKPFNDVELLEKILKCFSAPLIKSFLQVCQSENGFLLKWNDGYKIGVAEIDEEHKLIVDNFEKLYFSAKNGNGFELYNEILLFLEKYVSFHFEHEEAYQKSISYAGYDEHKSLHDNFRAQVLEQVKILSEKEVTSRDLVKLLLFIKEWVIYHILVEDKKIVR